MKRLAGHLEIDIFYVEDVFAVEVVRKHQFSPLLALDFRLFVGDFGMGKGFTLFCRILVWVLLAIGEVVLEYFFHFGTVDSVKGLEVNILDFEIELVPGEVADVRHVNFDGIVEFLNQAKKLGSLLVALN